MYQYASECIKMYAEWIVKMFGRKIIIEVPLWHSNGLKLGILAPKIAHLLLNAQNASICIRIHQNVCRMNCAKVLCMKLSKKWFWLHLKGPKLTKYIYLFMVVHPVQSIMSKVNLSYLLAADLVSWEKGNNITFKGFHMVGLYRPLLSIYRSTFKNSGARVLLRRP